MPKCSDLFSKNVWGSVDVPVKPGLDPHIGKLGTTIDMQIPTTAQYCSDFTMDLLQLRVTNREVYLLKKDPLYFSNF